MGFQDRQEVEEAVLEEDSRGSFRMDFQEQEVAEATVISGDYGLSRVDFEKLVYGFGPGGWFSNVRKIWSEILTRQLKIGL